MTAPVSWLMITWLALRLHVPAPLYSLLRAPLTPSLGNKTPKPISSSTPARTILPAHHKVLFVIAAAPSHDPGSPLPGSL